MSLIGTTRVGTVGLAESVNLKFNLKPKVSDAERGTSTMMNVKGISQ